MPLPNPHAHMKRILACLLALPLLTAVDASAQSRGMGGCARDTQQGYVTATETVSPVYWRGGDRAGTVEAGDELRLCRFEGDNAIITVWSHGIGYVVPRSAVSELRTEPTLREVTEQDLACIGREIDNVQETYRSEQDWKLLELARERGVSLSMLAAIRSAGTRLMIRGQEIPACDSSN